MHTCELEILCYFQAILWEIGYLLDIASYMKWLRKTLQWKIEDQNLSAVCYIKSVDIGANSEVKV